MSKYRRIRYEDRCQIYALSKRGASQESIASVLGVSQSAVSREMRRNRGQRGYRFKQAEATAQARQAIRSKPRKLTAPIRRKIETKLRQMRWSSEQISGWLTEQGIKLSHERIYQMIWDDIDECGHPIGSASRGITLPSWTAVRAQLASSRLLRSRAPVSRQFDRQAHGSKTRHQFRKPGGQWSVANSRSKQYRPAKSATKNRLQVRRCRSCRVS